jgi:hypothetical protein
MVPLVLLLTLVYGISQQQPAYPTWPATWTSNFTEVWDLATGGKAYTNGTYYYDHAHNKARLDRDNGQWDFICGLNGNKTLSNTPCSYYISDDIRYVYYPKLDECCNCCNQAHGCGVLSPDWMHPAEFQGNVTYNGQQAYKWFGGDKTPYHETIAENPLDRVMLDCNHGGHDDQIFYGRELSVPDGVFDLPKACDPNVKCS